MTIEAVAFQKLCMTTRHLSAGTLFCDRSMAGDREQQSEGNSLNEHGDASQAGRTVSTPAKRCDLGCVPQSNRKSVQGELQQRPGHFGVGIVGKRVDQTAVGAFDQP